MVIVTDPLVGPLRALIGAVADVSGGAQQATITTSARSARVIGADSAGMRSMSTPKSGDVRLASGEA
ncbi:MAG: hypothetical protein ABI629_16565 [bacterium]